MDNTKETLDHLNGIIQAKKKDQGRFYADMAEMYKSRADRSWLSKSDYDLAIESYKKSILIDPEEPEYYAKLAIIFCKKNLINDAIDNLKKAIELNQNERRYKQYYAKALAKWGSKKEDAEFHEKLGDIFEGLELFELAQKEYAKSAQLSPLVLSYRDKYIKITIEIGKRAGKQKRDKDYCEDCGRELLPWEFSICDICFNNNHTL